MRSLTGGGSGGSGSGDLSSSGFTMSGDINMGGHEVIGLDDASSDSSATSKKYVDDEIAKVNTGSALRKKPDIPTYSRLYMGRNKIHIPTHIACRNMVRNIMSNP